MRNRVIPMIKRLFMGDDYVLGSPADDANLTLREPVELIHEVSGGLRVLRQR